MQTVLRSFLKRVLDTDRDTKERPIESPFDHQFALWCQHSKSQITQHLIGGVDGEAKPRESTAARLESLQEKCEADQLSEARAIIQSLERWL